MSLEAATMDRMHDGAIDLGAVEKSLGRCASCMPEGYKNHQYHDS
jgi:hypothetical protein